MARLVLATAGAIVGGSLGGTYGAQAGWVIGSMIGGTFEPNAKQGGPRLGDLSVSGSSYGAPIPYVQGNPRVAGQIIWASSKREIATTSTQGGKGGGGGVESTTYTYEVDLLILVSSNIISGVTRVWSNGKLIWSGLGNLETAMASGGTSSWARMTSYGGGSSQLPDPTYEAAVGTANAPAYRGRGTVFIQSLQLGSSGQIPNLTFEIGSSASGTVICLHHFEDQGSEYYKGPYTPNPNYNNWLWRNGSAAIGPKWNYALWGWWSNTPVWNNECGIKPVGIFGRNSFVQYSNVFPGKGGNAQYATAWTLPDSSFAIGANEDFTFEIVHAPREIDGYNKGIYNSSSPAYLMLWGTSGVNGTVYFSNIWVGGSAGRAYSFGITGGGGVSHNANQPYPQGKPLRIGVTRQGTTLRLFIDGVLYATDTRPQNAIALLGSGYINLGSYGPADGITTYTGAGIFDELLIVRGVALFTSNYTPATNQYGNSNTVTVSSKTPPTLQSVVNNLLALAGLSPTQYDTSALASITTPVRAMAISQVSSIRSVLENLSSIYKFDLVLSDKLYFKVRGGSVVKTVAYADLGCDGGEPIVIKMGNDLEMPAQLALSFSNTENDHLADTVYSDRLISGQTSVTTLQVPLGLTASEAKIAVDSLLLDKIAAGTTTTVYVGIKYAMLEPLDPILLVDSDGNQWRMRIVKRTESEGMYKLDCVRDDASVFTQGGVVSTGTGTTAVTAPTVVDSIVLDIPMMSDLHNTPVLYAAAKGLGSGQAIIYGSLNNNSFDSVGTILSDAVFGGAISKLNDYSGPLDVFDFTSSVQVSVGSGQLSTVTVDALLASKSVNAAMIGSEMVQFLNATLVATGVYNLSGFLRGRKGTNLYMTGHAEAGESFCLLSAAGFTTIDLPNSEIGQLHYYRGVGAGQNLLYATSQSITPTGFGLKPYSPVDLRVNRVTNDTVFTWKRRTRLSTIFTGTSGISVPLGETTESYDIEFWTSGFATLKRTYAGLTSPTATYTSANQVTDFGSNQSTFYVKVYQNSAIVGRGHALTVTAAP